MAKQKNKLQPIDTPVYNYWSALYKSFYSRRLYVDVGKRWRGFGVLYLVLALAIFSIPFALRLVMDFNVMYQEQIIEPLQKIPLLYVQNGAVLFDKSMPYLIKNDKGKVIIIIDTTGKVNDFRHYPDLTTLINKNRILLKVPNPRPIKIMQIKADNASKPLVQTFDKEANFVFDGKKFAQEQSITYLKYFADILIYPMAIASFFSIFIVFFIVLGVLGEVFSSVFFSFKIKFKTSCHLLTVAGTPMLFVTMIFLTSNTIFPGLGVILFSLLIAYYSYAIYSLKAESKQVVIS
ncbi:MAG: DUF1189 family protein [Legionella sp.]